MTRSNLRGKPSAKFDLEITVSSTLITIFNLLIVDPAWKGVCSILSPAVSHYSLIWIKDILRDYRISRRHDRFVGRLEKVISKLEEEHCRASDSRKAELDQEICKLRKMLSENRLEMLNYQKPDYGRKSQLD